MKNTIYTTLFLALMALLSPISSAAENETDTQNDVTRNTIKDGPQPGRKGPGMGHDYQKNVPGPGQGEPDYRGGTEGDPNTPLDERGAGKGRGGAGVGEGYPGYRGKGGDNAPRHQQYGDPPRPKPD